MISIIAAMDEEINALKVLMSDIKEEKYFNIDFTLGKLSGKDVVLCKSGVGKVMAATSTTVIIEHYHPECIINIGSAGSLRSDIRMGSVVIPQRVAEHDLEVPGWEKDFKDERHTYYPDAKLLEVALKLKDDKTYFNDLVSGDIFVYQKAQYEKIIKEFPSAVACEMEGASIGGVATRLNVPFIIVRGISDVTIEEGSEMTFDEYLHLAAKNSALYCEKFVKEI